LFTAKAKSKAASLIALLYPYCFTLHAYLLFIGKASQL